jgi:4'-phosphopantetheinyl transferase
MSESPHITWPAAPANRVPASGEVHIWATMLDHDAARISQYRTVLSPDECARADRFHFERDRTRFIAARHFLRSVLGRIVSVSPDSLVFDYSPRGKPALASPPGLTQPFFNLSHSDALALLAVTFVGPVGVDVERLRVLNDADQLAARFFSKSEVQALQLLQPPQKFQTFFDLWTRKEAWLKATGKGIAGGLDQVEVAFTEGRVAAFERLFGSIDAALRWQLIELTPSEGFTGAMAIESNNIRPFFWLF